MTVVDNRMAIMQDEVFGPVIPVMKVTDFDEGLRLANESRYGLSAYVFTKDLRRLMRLIRELKFGEIYVNRPGRRCRPCPSCRAPRTAASAARTANTAWTPISRRRPSTSTMPDVS